MMAHTSADTVRDALNRLRVIDSRLGGNEALAALDALVRERDDLREALHQAHELFCGCEWPGDPRPSSACMGDDVFNMLAADPADVS